MNQGALHFDALLTVNNFDQGITRIKNSIREASGVAKSEADKMDSYFKNLGTAIGGYLSAQSILSFTKELINVRGEFQKTEIAFTTMLGSAEKAKQLMGQMVKLAAETPFGLEDVSSGAKQLLAFQVPANEVVETLTRLGNIAAGLNVPLSRINLIYGQVKAKGKLMGGELLQFTEAGIPMIAELANKFKKTEAEISDMVSAGKIGFKDVQDVLFKMTNEGGMFFELMEKQSASLSGKVANLEDTWDQMLNTIGESNEGLLNSGIEGLTYMVENYQKIVDILEGLIVTYGAYKAAVIATSAAQSFANKTVQSEIALLSISEKMKLGRAMVTQRQTAATAQEAAAEVENVKAKFAALRAENAILIAKKETLRQAGLSTLAKWQEARAQLSMAKLELSSMQATGTAREIEIAQKRVTIAQNAVLSSQATATVAKNAAIANSVAIWRNNEVLKNTAQAIGTAQGAAAVASEAAQVAAKNANTIATARLTAATYLRTAATQLATQAQAILNATMLNNPYVIVIALAVALTYAYFKLRDTSTAASIAEKQLNDEREKSSKLIEDVKNKTQELTAIINSDTATKLQQLEAYKQMQAIYPSLLKDLDLETFKKLGAAEAQKKLNAEMDKFSTMTLKKNVEDSKSAIKSLEDDIRELNQILKKRDGDSGIYLTKLEFAEKNLAAQKIILEKYNTELEERLQNEKISSMNLAEQKKYWEDQVASINKQISALEQSNIKKAKGLDQIANTSTLVKSTALDFLNWNISPLLSQLSRAQSEISKINNAQNETGVSKNKAYWEAQKKAASEANDAMSGSQINSAAWKENIRKIKEAELQLKKYDYTDREFLKAQKERDKERKKLEKGAEKSYTEGSVKRLEQQINLLEEALSRSDGKNVRLRYIDKYGKERNAEEIRSVKSVQDEVLRLREERAAKEKLIEVRTLQERIDESERQWNNYYKMAEFYGKQSADAQYKTLFQDSQSYLDYLEKQAQALSDLAETSVLSDQQKQDLVFLQGKIRELDGTETPLENFKRGIDNALKGIPSLVDQIEYLNAAEVRASKKAGSNTQTFLDSKKYIEDQKRAVIQQQKDVYQEFLNNQQSFEQKKLDIEQKFNDIRKKIGEDETLTDDQRLKRLAEVTKAEGKEISSASMEAFKKTDLWVKAFGDLDRVGPKTLLKLKKSLEDYLNSDKGKALAPTELKEMQDQIKKLNDLITSNNPFKAIGIAVDVYRKKREELNAIEKKSGKGSEEYQIKLEETKQAFVGIVEVTGAAAKATIEAVANISDAFGGLSDELRQTLAEVQQLIEGIINAVVGYFSGNYGQMISGIVQIVAAMVKLLSGDKYHERYIKRWQLAVDELKSSYDALNHSIKRTAGDAQLAMQRGLIENLEEQKRLLKQMREQEEQKKKADKEKIAGFNNQISQIDQQLLDVMDNFKKTITTTDFKDLSQKLADALIEAFGQGEDAAQAFDKVVDEVMRNAVANALKIKFLDKAAENIVESIYSSMGFGNSSQNTNDAKIKEYEAQVDAIEKKIKDLNASATPKPDGWVGSWYSPVKEIEEQQKKKEELLDLIGKLKAEMASIPLEGSFDGLTPEEREKIKQQGQTAMQQYMDALKQYEDLFGASAENAQGLKGDIKGITEKTAGALESQINVLRIMEAEILKIHRANQKTFSNQLNVLSQIEVNTRNLVDIRKDISEMNSKMKKSLAGIP